MTMASWQQTPWTPQGPEGLTLDGMERPGMPAGPSKPARPRPSLGDRETEPLKWRRVVLASPAEARPLRCGGRPSPLTSERGLLSSSEGGSCPSLVTRTLGTRVEGGGIARRLRPCSSSHSPPIAPSVPFVQTRLLPTAGCPSVRRVRWPDVSVPPVPLSLGAP